jgi:hypothetical protein
MGNDPVQPDATDGAASTGQPEEIGADGNGDPALGRVSGAPDDSSDVHTNSLADPAGLETEAVGEQDPGRSRDGA